MGYILWVVDKEEKEYCIRIFGHHGRGGRTTGCSGEKDLGEGWRRILESEREIL